jgi:hypothetical protein
MKVSELGLITVALFYRLKSSKLPVVALKIIMKWILKKRGWFRSAESRDGQALYKTVIDILFPIKSIPVRLLTSEESTNFLILFYAKIREILFLNQNFIRVFCFQAYVIYIPPSFCKLMTPI